jgi:hypothetical protein
MEVALTDEELPEGHILVILAGFVKELLAQVDDIQNARDGGSHSLRSRSNVLRVKVPKA